MESNDEFIVLVRGKDRYIFFYNSENQGDREKLLEIFDKYASDKELSFSRRDADYLTKKVQKEICENQLDVSDRLEHMFKN